MSIHNKFYYYKQIVNSDYLLKPPKLYEKTALPRGTGKRG